jgi:hypothetical protein
MPISAPVRRSYRLKSASEAMKAASTAESGFRRNVCAVVVVHALVANAAMASKTGRCSRSGGYRDAMSWFLLLVIRSLGHCRRGQVPAGGAVNLSRGLLAVRFAILAIPVRHETRLARFRPGLIDAGGQTRHNSAAPHENNMNMQAGLRITPRGAVIIV